MLWHFFKKVHLFVPGQRMGAWLALMKWFLVEIVVAEHQARLCYFNEVKVSLKYDYVFVTHTILRESLPNLQ